MNLMVKSIPGNLEEKKIRGFLNFPQDVKMGFEGIYPRGIFIDFEESSSRNYLLEDFVPRELFLCLEEQKPRDVNTRFFSSRYHPRGEIFLLEEVKFSQK